MTGKGIRIECRIGGADLNPYLALAGLIAAGIAGIEAGLPLGPEAAVDAYRDETAPEIPKTLRAATDAFRASAMLRAVNSNKVACTLCGLGGTGRCANCACSQGR